jgi:hypothetical protein
MSDPVAEFLRGEREVMLRAGPAPHAARLWHEARRRHAASLRRAMGIAGWLVRLVVAAATLMSCLSMQPQADFLLLLLALSMWLTWGACAPVRRQNRRKS